MKVQSMLNIPPEITQIESETPIELTLNQISNQYT